MLQRKLPPVEGASLVNPCYRGALRILFFYLSRTVCPSRYTVSKRCADLRGTRRYQICNKCVCRFVEKVSVIDNVFEYKQNFERVWWFMHDV